DGGRAGGGWGWVARMTVQPGRPRRGGRASRSTSSHAGAGKSMAQERHADGGMRLESKATRNGEPMSQSCVERIIGVLATDEGLRRRFRKNPRAALQEVVDRGLGLNDGEMAALAKREGRGLM